MFKNNIIFADTDATAFVCNYSVDVITLLDEKDTVFEAGLLNSDSTCGKSGQLRWNPRNGNKWFENYALCRNLLFEYSWKSLFRIQKDIFHFIHD